MPAASDYVTGTISLTNGSINFTGTSTGWLLAGFKEGDTIIDITGATEFMGVIATIDANGAGTLTKAWEGPTLVDVAYRMRYQPDGARVSAQARNLIELLGNGNLQAIAGLPGSASQLPMFTGPGAMTLVPKTDLVSGADYDVQVADLAARAAYDAQAEGYSVLVADTGDGRAAIYSKVSASGGDWSDPAYVTGPVGPSPVFAVTSTTTLDPGDDATFVVSPNVAEDGYDIEVGIPAGRGATPRGTYDSGTAYILDDAVLYDGSTFIALQATTGNAPPTLPTTSNAYWQLLARQGIDGAGTVNSVVAGTGISVDNADPTAPVVALANMANATFKGRNTAGTGAPEDVTVAQILTLLKASGAYAKDNVLGTVSQSGGVPTGAVIERGSNANGEYVKFADGTMITVSVTPVRSIPVTTAFGSVFISAAQTWNLPAAFAAAPSHYFTSINNASGIVWYAPANITDFNTTVRFYIIQATSGTNSAMQDKIVSIGRWF